MKPHDSLLRLRQFEVEERQQKVRDLESMIDEFRRMVLGLDHQIETEETRSGVADKDHYSYSPFAKASFLRRDNLIASTTDLEAKVIDAHEDLSVAVDELNKVEMFTERSQGRAPQRDAGATNILA